jgi:micrococcal nuclease
MRVFELIRCCAPCFFSSDDLLASATYENAEKFVLPVTRGKVVKIYDGDTVTVAFYMNAKLYRTQVRLLGIDAAELKGSSDVEKFAARQAKDALSLKIMGKTVDLRKVGTEKYGRLLAEVWLGDENVCEWMLSQGHAVPYTGGTKTFRWD